MKSPNPSLVQFTIFRYENNGLYQRVLHDCIRDCHDSLTANEI